MKKEVVRSLQFVKGGPHVVFQKSERAGACFQVVV